MLCSANATQSRAADLAIAPIRATGSVSYDVRAEHIEHQADRLQQLCTASVNVSSYLWEPWIAVVNGGLAYTFTDVNEAQAGERDHFLSGTGRLFLLPRSRFPFDAHVDLTDSRVGLADSSMTGYRSLEYGFVQRYRPEDSSAQFTASFDHRNQESMLSGDFEQQQLRLDFSQSVAHHNLSVSSDLSDSRRTDAQQDLRYHTFVARDRYAPSSSISVDTVANLTETSTDFSGIETPTRFVQVSSVAFWRAQSRPLTVSASARFFDYESMSGTQQLSDSRQEALNVGATYLAGAHWRYTAGANLGRTRNGGVDDDIASASAGASWQATTLSRGAFDYDRYAGATFALNRVDPVRDESDPFALSLQAGHVLTWTRPSTPGARLTFTLGQSLTSETGSSRTAADDTGVEFSNTAAATWSSSSELATTYLRLSIADTRTLGVPAGRELQLANLQATRIVASGAATSWSGTLTLQASRQRYEFMNDAGSDPGFHTTATADLSYHRDRVFGVPQLRFTSLLRLSDERQLQVYRDPHDRESQSFENRLDWRIGRLSTGISLRAARVDGQLRTLATFKVIRDIGN